MIRVALIGSGPPARGGIPSCIELICRPGAFHEAIVIVPVNTSRLETRTAGRFELGNVKAAVSDTVRTWRAARRADIAHLHVAPGRPLPLVRALAMCAAARMAGAGVVCHVHSARLNGGRPEEVYPGPLYRWLLRRLSVAHTIVTVSDRGRDLLRRYVPGVEVETIDNAVEVAAFPRAHPATEPPVVVFVGTISERKGLRDLLSAAIELRERGIEKWTLRVVGGANEVGEKEAESIREAYRSAGFGDSLVGSLDAPGVRRELAAAAVFVLPSYAEGQPIAILEAMAAGLPVVSTRVGAVPDVVTDDVSGLLVECGAPTALAVALERLITDPSLRQRFGDEGYRVVSERHDVPVLAEHLGELYRRHARTRR